MPMIKKPRFPGSAKEDFIIITARGTGGRLFEKAIRGNELSTS